MQKTIAREIHVRRNFTLPTHNREPYLHDTLPSDTMAVLWTVWVC